MTTSPSHAHEVTTNADSAEQATELKRVFGVPALLFFGLAYMVPLTVFSTYGIVTEATQGHLAGAYVVTVTAMLFTALSYASIVRKLPTAGSAYGYARSAFGRGFGFVTGWALMIDYALLPMINYMLLGLYLNAQFPALPQWAVILIAIAAVTTLNIIGVSVVKNVNTLLVAFQLVFVAVFVVLDVTRLGEPGAETNVFAPFWSENAEFALIAGGASILALSFLGFDAVSAMAEEAKQPRRSVPIAVVLTVLVGGVMFMTIAWLGQMTYPDYTTYTNADTASLELISRLGGTAFEAFFLTAYLIGCIASALTSQASTARVLFSMGRDGALPERFFGRLNPRFRTPSNAVLVIAAISLLAMVLPLDAVISVISFGALAAFSVVNLAVIKFFLIDRKLRDFRSLLQYGLLPLIGFALTVWLWTSLDATALLIGGIWVVIGVIYLAIISRGFRKMPKTQVIQLD